MPRPNIPPDPLGLARFSHSAVLMSDGAVIFSGGFPGGGGKALETCEAFFPGYDQIRSAGDLHQRRGEQTSTLLADGSILIVGGCVEFGMAIKSCERRLALGNVNHWHSIPVADLNFARAHHAAHLLPNHRVFVIGSILDGVNTAEEYDPESDIWSIIPYGKEQRFFRSEMVNGQVLIMGGVFSRGSGIGNCFIYNPETKAFRETGSLNIPRWAFSSVVMANGNVFALGGHGSNPPEIYCTQTDKWELIEPTRYPRRDPGLVNLPDSRVFVIGGNEAPDIPCEVFDPSTGTWAEAPTPKQYRRRFNSVTTLADGRILIAGGRDSMTALAITEVFDPETWTWSWSHYHVVSDSSDRKGPMPWECG